MKDDPTESEVQFLRYVRIANEIREYGKWKAAARQCEIDGHTRGRKIARSHAADALRCLRIDLAALCAENSQARQIIQAAYTDLPTRPQREARP